MDLSKYEQLHLDRVRAKEKEEDVHFKAEEKEVEALLKWLHAIQDQLAKRGCVAFSHVSDPHPRQRLFATTAIYKPMLWNDEDAQGIIEDACDKCVEDITKVWQKHCTPYTVGPAWEGIFEREEEDE